MRFEEIVPALRECKKVKRSHWPSEWYISFIKGPDDDGTTIYACNNTDFRHYYAFTKEDFSADDWEILEEDDEEEIVDDDCLNYNRIYNEGYEKGFNEGYDEGYETGLNEGDIDCCHNDEYNDDWEEC